MFENFFLSRDIVFFQSKGGTPYEEKWFFFLFLNLSLIQISFFNFFFVEKIALKSRAHNFLHWWEKFECKYLIKVLSFKKKFYSKCTWKLTNSKYSNRHLVTILHLNSFHIMRTEELRVKTTLFQKIVYGLQYRFETSQGRKPVPELSESLYGQKKCHSFVLNVIKHNWWACWDR